MKGMLCVFFVLMISHLSAQKVSGIVKDEMTGRPLGAVSIFFSNTSTGTRTDVNGKFELQLQDGKSELVASSVGYQTFSMVLKKEEQHLVIALKPKITELDNIVVESFEKDGWGKWGLFFRENFIGTSDFAKQCRILNPEVLRFRNSKTTGKLNAVALEPLIIENKSLGYRIHYQMESFEFNFKERLLFYTGYPFFEVMRGSKGQEKKWVKNRKEAFEGSLLHFMRSLYVNQLKEEGFEVRRLVKIPNLEKQRVKAAYPSNMKTTRLADGTPVISSINQDTAEYYGKILRQTDYQDIIGRGTLTGDSIAFAISENIAGLQFPDYLLVIYKRKMVPAEFIQRFPESSTAMMSQIILLNAQPLEIYSNGSYYDPENLLSLGFWSWFEKIATMLPLDYNPDPIR